MLRKILISVFVIIILGCSPYQKIIVHPNSWFGLVIDTCDYFLLNNMIDSLGFGNQLIELASEEPCECIECRTMNFGPSDTIGSLFTVRPLQVGNDTALIERIYTVQEINDSSIIIICHTADHDTPNGSTQKKYMSVMLTIPILDTTDIRITVGAS